MAHETCCTRTEGTDIIGGCQIKSSPNFCERATKSAWQFLVTFFSGIYTEMQNVLAILLAGGAGERLFPLTKDTAKPAVPFGGAYRIIDFTLSNCINSDVRRIFVLTQYKSLELTRHIRDGWNILSAELGEFIEVIPPMKRVHDDWYQGTADAVFQNFQSIEVENPEETLI